MPSQPLPKGWTEVHSKSRPGKVYYINKKTGEKTWKYKEVSELANKKSKKKKSSASSSSGGGSSKPRDNKPERKHSVCTDDGELTEGPDKVQVLHLLVKHRDSRRPSSWRQDNIVISKAVARDRCSSLRKKILQEAANADFTRSKQDIIREQFEKLAKEESDCSSAKRGGDLGKFERGAMQPSFENAAFGLEVNEMSDLVESNSGVHIILRIA